MNLVLHDITVTKYNVHVQYTYMYNVIHVPLSADREYVISVFEHCWKTPTVYVIFREHYVVPYAV